jgi:quercetin dioxygenase-like cupin family protein
MPEHLSSAADGETITDREQRRVVMLASHHDITVTWYRIGPGEEGPEPHVHHLHTDAFYVLEGELGFRLGPDREPVSTGAGGLVAAPPNVVHTFVNDGNAEVEFLNIHTPDGGFGAFMRARRDGDEEATFDTAEPPPDGGRPLSEAIVCGPGEGERLERANRVALLKAALPEMSFFEFTVEGPLGGPAPHHHDDQVDNFYVLSGELEILAGEVTHRAGPGAFASIPRGVTHAFAHRSEDVARFLNVHAPDAGFANFIRG